jgi:hypothetical protein
MPLKTAASAGADNRVAGNNHSAACAGAVANLLQHREKPTEGSRFAAVDNSRITFQEPVHRSFIHLVQVKLPEDRGAIC